MKYGKWIVGGMVVRSLVVRILGIRIALFVWPFGRVGFLGISDDGNSIRISEFKLK